MFNLAEIAKYLPLIQQLIELIQSAMAVNKETIASNEKTIASNKALSEKIDAMKIDKDFVAREYGNQ